MLGLRDFPQKGLDAYEMTDNTNNRRLAKTTLILYIRMMFTRAVSLFTSRVILTTLGIEDYGIFLSLNDHVVGLIHISEISESFVRNISDYVDLGETINAIVIGDDGNSHLKLSIKNFDYRIHKKEQHLIKETPSGFTNLSTALYDWIDSKVVEINKKS